jgi:predicted DNA binding CopG/RHH family protein
MKEPKLSDLEFDKKATQRLRQKMAKARPVKITINIDSNSLQILRVKSAETGIPYQRLLNRLLQKALQRESETESRLDRLEKEIGHLRRKIVA